MKHQLLVDLRGLFDIFATLHESHEYSMCQTVQKFCDFFDCGNMDTPKLIQGKVNVDDARTGNSPVLRRYLNRSRTSDVLELVPP